MLRGGLLSSRIGSALAFIGGMPPCLSIPKGLWHENPVMLSEDGSSATSSSTGRSVKQDVSLSTAFDEASQHASSTGGGPFSLLEEGVTKDARVGKYLTTHESNTLGAFALGPPGGLVPQRGDDASSSRLQELWLTGLGQR